MDTSHRKGIYQIGVKAPIFFIGANKSLFCFIYVKNKNALILIIIIVDLKSVYDTLIIVF